MEKTQIKRKTKVTYVIGEVRRRKVPGHEYEITDGHRVSPPGQSTNGKYLQNDRRDDGEKN